MLYSLRCVDSSEPSLELHVGLSSPSSLGVHQLMCYDSSNAPYAANMYMEPASLDSTPDNPSVAFSDGVSLGWGVVAAMVAAYSIHLLRRAL